MLKGEIKTLVNAKEKNLTMDFASVIIFLWLRSWWGKPKERTEKTREHSKKR